MGSKRPNLKPPSSSSDEEEASAGEDSSSEEEQQLPASPPPPTKNFSSKSIMSKTKPSTKSSQKPTVAAAASAAAAAAAADEDDDDDDDEEDESDDSPVAGKKDPKEKEDEEGEASSDEEEEPAKHQPLKKPDSSAMPGSDSDSSSDSEPYEKQAVAKVEPAAESGRKRQRISAPSEVENSEKKQKLFQRFWGQEDETKILEAIISFYSNKGSEPPSNAGYFTADLDGILDLLKKSVTAEFTKGQLGTKIRNLRRKFLTNASREKTNAGLKFSKPHDQDVYELSKKIWQLTEPLGDGIGSVKSVKSKGKSLTLKKVKEQDGDDLEVDACYEYLAKAIAWAKPLNMDNLSINKGLKLIDPTKARPLEKRLRALESERFGHRMKWMDKLEEASQMIKDAVEKSAADAFCHLTTTQSPLEPSLEVLSSSHDQVAASAAQTANICKS